MKIFIEIKIMKFFLIFLIYVISIGNLSAFENKIILKIEDEIITSIDIDNEKNYLKHLTQILEI